jgi:hypothetical protein
VLKNMLFDTLPDGFNTSHRLHLLQDETSKRRSKDANTSRGWGCRTSSSATCAIPLDAQIAGRNSATDTVRTGHSRVADYRGGYQAG